MQEIDSTPVIAYVLDEQRQRHRTRKSVIAEIEKELGRSVVTFFTSFKWPVILDDSDADILEGILQKTDLSNGLALIISSPGGDGLAAERIINICRSYSNTKDYWAVVPNKAKSAGTIVCLGASKIIMGETSELGPIDPQIFIPGTGLQRFSVYNIVKSYDNLFNNAVKEKQGNLEPYLQQLDRYDEREIEEYRAALSLSADIAVRCLQSGMLLNASADSIKKSMKIFLSPETTKTHGRAIYRKDAKTAGLKIESLETGDRLWTLLHELYTRTNNFSTTQVSKCIETLDHSFVAPIPDKLRGPH